MIHKLDLTTSELLVIAMTIEKCNSKDRNVAKSVMSKISKAVEQDLQKARKDEGQED